MLDNYRIYDFNIKVPFQVAGSAIPDPLDATEIAEKKHGAVISLFEKSGYNKSIIPAFLEKVKEHNIAHFHLELDDFAGPSLEKIFAFIKIIFSCKNNGVFPFVHCRGGNGRTGTMLAALHIWQTFYNEALPEDMWEPCTVSSYDGDSSVDSVTKSAIDFIREQSPHAVETAEQIDSLANLTETLYDHGLPDLNELDLEEHEVLIPVNVVTPEKTPVATKIRLGQDCARQLFPPFAQ